MTRRAKNCMGGEVKRSRGFGCQATRSQRRAFLLSLFITYGSVAC